MPVVRFHSRRGHSSGISTDAARCPVAVAPSCRRVRRRQRRSPCPPACVDRLQKGEEEGEGVGICECGRLSARLSFFTLTAKEHVTLGVVLAQVYGRGQRVKGARVLFSWTWRRSAVFFLATTTTTMEENNNNECLTSKWDHVPHGHGKKSLNWLSCCRWPPSSLCCFVHFL